MSDFESNSAGDEELMAGIAGGDEQAFRRLVERHSEMVRGTAARMLRDSSEAEDLAQKIFLRVWRAAGKYRSDGKFTTWLLTITRNTILGELRKKKIRALFSGQLVEDDERPLPEAAALDWDSPDQRAAAAELGRAVEAAMAKLPEKQRMALVLHRFEQVPHEEIAIILRTTVPSVKSLIFRARESLQKSLAGWLREG